MNAPMQQKGFVHGGVIADSACDHAAYSLMPADCTLVTAEYKINKAGRTLTVARAEVYAVGGTHVATMQQTLMMLPGRTDHPE